MLGKSSEIFLSVLRFLLGEFFSEIPEIGNKSWSASDSSSELVGIISLDLARDFAARGFVTLPAIKIGIHVGATECTLSSLLSVPCY